MWGRNEQEQDDSADIIDCPIHVNDVSQHLSKNFVK